MPLKPKSHKKLLLSVLIAGTLPPAHAADGWDCMQTQEGWNCSAADFVAQPQPAKPAPALAPVSEPVATEPPRIEAAEAAETPAAPQTTEPKPLQASPVVAQPEEKPSATTQAEAIQPENKQKPETEPQVAAVEPVAENLVEPQPAQPSGAADVFAATNESYMNLDWVTLSPVDTQGKVCKGGYVEPNLWLAETSSDDETITIDADSSSSQQGGMTELRGNVLLRQPGRQVEASAVDIDSVARQAYLEGNVRYREPGFLYRADTASIDLESDISYATDAQFITHANEMRGAGSKMTRFPNKTIETQDALVTYCEPGNDDWAIRAQEMILHTEEGYGETWHTRFEVAGVPVFYLPYFYFPLDDTRRTGFLYPTLSQDKENGWDIAAPYYFNIAPNIDDTLTTRIIEKRGLLLENELRYLNSISMNQLSTGWMPSDDLRDRERWAINFDHQGNPAPGWSSAIDFTRVSDNDYFDDLAPIDLRIPQSDDLSQRASLNYSTSTWTASALVHDYQTIDGGAEPYARMPQLTLSGAESFDAVNLGYLAQYTDFQHETRTDGQRIHLRPALTHDWSRPWGFMRPELGLWNSSYDLSDGTSPTATANFASLDSGLIFERQGELATQTLEPRVKLIHVGGDDTQLLPSFDSSALGFSAANLFNTLGYSGNDRVAQTDQATLGLNSRVFSLSGREVVTAGIAQAHYFKDHERRPGDASGTDDQSDYALSAGWKPSDALKLSHDSRIDKDDGTLLAQNYAMLYNPDPSKLLYTSFRQTKSSATAVTKEQVDVGAKWPLSPAWSIVGRYTEDLLVKENLETLLGVEYGSCCWKVRFTGQRTVVDGSSDFERSNTFYLQFVLKGLGTTSGAEGREFLKDLTGFDEDANENF